MGPPKETSPPLIFGQDFQPNLLVNEQNDPKSSVSENDADDHTSENVKSKRFDNPPIPGLGEKSANILQSTSMPLLLPEIDSMIRSTDLQPAVATEKESSYRPPFLQLQTDSQSEEKDYDNSDSIQIPLLEDKPSSQIYLGRMKSDIEDSAHDSSFNEDLLRSEIPTPQSPPLQEKLFENSQINNDAASDDHTIPEGFENSNITKETSSSNDPQIGPKEAIETENGLAEAGKENLDSSLPQTQEFLSSPDKNIEEKTLQSSSAESNVKNPHFLQYSNTTTIHSSYEEREEKCFFDRAKFIAICGEDLLDQSQEPWPQDVKLYQPYEVEQVILPDNANCLAVQAYLKMCGLDFQIEQRHNAEYMSPSGRVPFIKCGAFVVSELDPIIAFINTKGVSLTAQLDAGQRADMRAYMSLANTVLANAELYIAWVDATTAKEVTRPRYGSVHPWPLNLIVTWQKSRQVRKRLAVLGWLQKSLQEVFAEVENCCNALSERLDKKDFFFGSRPTELDALVFGHLFTVLTTPLPNNRLASIVRGYPTLVELVKRVESQFFQREN